MKRFNKVYLEISNMCNLSCAFCPGTTRSPRRMNAEDFALILEKLQPWTDYLYFHLMGEPLCHPNLEHYLALAAEFGFKVILTTNGTLLPRSQTMLLSSPALHKVNISLHAFEANDLAIPFGDYLNGCFAFGQAAQGSKLVVYRLWNEGGADAMNERILDSLHHHFPNNWIETRRGTRIGDRVYLEFGEKFDWPDLSAPEGSDCMFCYGLRDQIGILCDGTVVPCCLDHDGDIPLGNLLRESIEEILENHRAKSIYAGFTNHTAVEELCRKCGYARRFR